MLFSFLFFWNSQLFEPSNSFAEYEWGSWSNWPMACSSTCQVGQRCRVRKCQNNKGNVAEMAKCGKITEGKECQNCVSKGICPIDAQWGEWSTWTDCKMKASTDCGKGTKQRVRICNDPKPKYGGMFCIGNSTEEGECSISCSDEGDQKSFLKDSINEHFRTLSYNVIIKSRGDPAELDCYTPAYLKASVMKKKMFVLWHFNGLPLKSLRELLLEDMKALQGKMMKAGAQTSFKLPKGHFQFTGSKLIIDSVSDDDTGVFMCTLNYDYTDFINTFFVLMISGRREIGHEFGYFTYNSNTDGLQDVEYFDRAEIRWYLNRRCMFSGLLASFDKRFYTILVNKTLEGYWECHLYADFNKRRHWIVNSFYLKITYPRSLWDKFSDEPLLTAFCYYFISGIFLMGIVSITSFLVVKFRSTDWLNLERKEAIIQEETDNNRLILMVARKRAMQKTIELMGMAGEVEEEDEDSEYETDS